MKWDWANWDWAKWGRTIGTDTNLKSVAFAIFELLALKNVRGHVTLATPPNPIFTQSIK